MPKLSNKTSMLEKPKKVNVLPINQINKHSHLCFTASQSKPARMIS